MLCPPSALRSVLAVFVFRAVSPLSPLCFGSYGKSHSIKKRKDEKPKRRILDDGALGPHTPPLDLSKKIIWKVEVLKISRWLRHPEFVFSSFRLFDTKSRREEFRQVARLPADGIRNHVEVETSCLHFYTESAPE